MSNANLVTINNKNYRLVSQPEDMKVELFQHQRYNIKQMEKLEKTKMIEIDDDTYVKTKIGILADPPGTGKTFTIIGLIMRDKIQYEKFSEEDMQLVSNGSGSLQIFKKLEIRSVNCSLIITPLSILEQWKKEFKHTPLRVKIVKSKADCDSIKNYDVVLCSVTMYKNFIAEHGHLTFKRFVYDEMDADSSYIPTMPAVKAHFFWFISATFEYVFNNIVRSRRVHFLKQLFLNITSDSFDPTTLINSISIKSPEELRNLNPIKAAYATINYNIQMSNGLRRIQDLVPEDVMNLIEAGNVKQAMKALGGESASGNIFDIIKKRLEDEIENIQTRNRRGKMPKATQEHLEELKRKLATLQERVNNLSIAECPVCYEEMKIPVLYTCCLFCVCVNCTTSIKEAGKGCPLCRNSKMEMIHLESYKVEDGEVKIIEQKEQKESNDKVLKGEHTVETKNYFDAIEQIIGKHKKKKFLFFAMDESNFPKVEEILTQKKLKHDRISGHISTRANTIEEFTNGDINALLLNSRNNGAGINLQAATDIVLMHRMPENLERQALGRVFRYKLKHEVTVHKLYTQ